MRGRTIRTIFIFAVMCLSLLASTQVNAQRYSGRATAIKATVGVPSNPITTAVNDTGELPSAGGDINLASNSTNILSGTLTAGTSSSRTRGGAGASRSETSVANLNFSVLGNTITALAISTVTDCSCPTGTCTGSTTITGLTLNGSSVTVTGEINQTIELRLGGVITGVVVGTLVINEQISSTGSITVNGLHVRVTDSITGVVTDVVVASSHSDIICEPLATDNFYSGRAFGIESTVTVTDLILDTVSTIDTIVADTGPLPASGGSIVVQVAGANIPGVATSSTLRAATSGGISGAVRASDSSARVENLRATVAGFVITASVLTSQTHCECTLGGTTSTCTGGSQVLGLLITAPISGQVLGTVTGAPNEVVRLRVAGVIVATLIFNEQIPTSPTGTGSITVNALHIITTTSVPDVSTSRTDTIIASSHSDIECGTVDASASIASVRGQVVNNGNRPVAWARVTMAGNEGETYSAVTNGFGYFSIEGLPAGQTYIVSIAARGYSFEPQAINIDEDLKGLVYVIER